MDYKDLALRKLKNQWKKDKAILEQQNQLLSIDVQELKDRALNLKKSNAALVQSIGSVRSSQLFTSQSRLVRLEVENKKLKSKLTEVSRDKDKLQQKKQKLKTESSVMKEKFVLCSREKKVKEQKHFNQIKKLEIEFEKLRMSNDKLLDAFKSVIVQGGRDKGDRERQPSLLRQSMDSSTVNICTRCANSSGTHDSRVSLRTNEECAHRSLASSQVVILNTEVPAKKRGSISLVKPLPIPQPFSVNTALHLSRRDRSQAIHAQNSLVSDILQGEDLNQAEPKNISSQALVRTSSIRQVSKQLYRLDSSRLATETEQVVSARSFRRKSSRGSSAGYVAALSRARECVVAQRLEYSSENNDKVLDRRDNVRQSLQSGTRVTMERSMSRVEDGLPNGSTTLRKDYSSKDYIGKQSSIPVKVEKIFEPDIRDVIPLRTEVRNSSEQDNRRDLPRTSMQGSERKSDRSWIEDKENVERRLNKPADNVFKASSRESAKDCMSFNDMLREKLANIENKLKAKKNVVI